MHRLFILFTAFCLTIFCSDTYGQNNTPGINFYIECEDCDPDYIRQEMSFISFVRDPNLADVHILVTESNTGSGGHKYFLSFIGKKEFEGRDYEYTTNSGPNDTDDQIRKNLNKIFITGILQYYSGTDFMNNLEIEVSETANRKADQMNIEDPWRKWIFTFSNSGEFEKEQSQNQYGIVTEGGIKKTREEWKTSLTGTYQLDIENYSNDDTVISNRQNEWELSYRFIKSLSEHWSSRVYAESSASTFLNIKNHYAGSAGIEYNFFPWKESNRRIFAIRYDLRAAHNRYIEETIYGKVSEALISQSAEMHLEVVEPWGQVSLSLEGSHLFKDFSKNRLTFETDISWRLSKNFSVFCNIESDMVHDQVYLPKGDASIEDILLRRRKLATTYEMRGRAGLRFVFGSIYDNVVNERF
ncbi:MAG TPA: DUF481 domain-containing protein [Bacteroidales bacterium]|nr:DUF481 domain-containing protein [Bacteroidales bacterium]